MDEELQSRLTLAYSDIGQAHNQLDLIDRRLGIPTNVEAMLPQRLFTVRDALAGGMFVSRMAAVTSLGLAFGLGVGVGWLLAKRRERFAAYYAQQAAQAQAQSWR